MNRSIKPMQSPVPEVMRGWTLIELITVLAIMALLTAIAWPSYTQHVQRGHRLEAVAALLEAQHFMERHYTAFGSYSSTVASGASSGTAPVAPALPLRLQNIPAAGPRYVLSVAQVTANSYTLSAVPTGTMTNDRCATLTLTHTLVRGTAGGTATAAECWR